MTSPFQRLFNLLAITLLAMATLGGCSAMMAQNPTSPLQPVNAVADGVDANLMLKGADLVAYFTEQRYLPGQPQFKSQYQGVDFRFASAANKALFDLSPRKYLPEFGGF